MQYPQSEGDIYRPYFEANRTRSEDVRSRLDDRLEFITLHKGTRLFHAAEDLIEMEMAKECPETGKRGAYFSAGDAFLAEVRTVETLKDMYIKCFRTSEDIILNVGRYGFTRGYTGRYATTHWTVPDEDNLSHIDNEIGTFDVNVIEHTHGPEIFLNENDLEKIQFHSNYFLTVGECIRKWYKQTWFEDIVNRGLRRLSNVPEVPFTQRTLKHDNDPWVRTRDE